MGAAHRELQRRSLLAAMAVDALPALASAGLRVGGFVVAPFMLDRPGATIGGALPGFLRREVEPQLGFPLHWQPAMTFARAMRSLREGSLDLMLMVGDSAGGPREVGRFAWSYLRTTPHLAVREAAALRAVHQLQDLVGLQIGWLAHSRLPPELEPLAIRWRLTSTQHWQLVNLRMLMAERLDAAYFANPYSPAYFIRREALALRLLALPLAPRALRMCHSLRADAQLLRQFDAVASRAFQGERFERWLQQYGGD